MLLDGSETCPVVTKDVPQLVTANSDMSYVSLKDRIPTTNILLGLGLLSSINDMLPWDRLRFHGNLLRMDDAWSKKTTIHYVHGKQPSVM